MSNPQPMPKQRVRFEEVTPANTVVAFFEVQLKPLAAWLQIPIFDGYDDLDEMQFTLLTLPSGRTVTVQEYEHAPRSGMNLYVDNSIPNISEVVFEACQRLEIPRSKVIWFHPDFQMDIDRLYTEHGDITTTYKSLQTKELTENTLYEPIDCFQHTLRIYTEQHFPEYWAMLQRNLGLAYFNRVNGSRLENLEESIECFNLSLNIYTEKDFPEQWRNNQFDLEKTLHSLEELRLSQEHNIFSGVNDKENNKRLESSREIVKFLSKDYLDFIYNKSDSESIYLESFKEFLFDVVKATVCLLGVFFAESYLVANDLASESWQNIPYLSVKIVELIVLINLVSFSIVKLKKSVSVLLDFMPLLIKDITTLLKLLRS
jgi:tetratricopeptide (TPR) repeat protein